MQLVAAFGRSFFAPRSLWSTQLKRCTLTRRGRRLMSQKYDVVRIAESYVDSLLFGAPAEEAVRQLSGEWSRRGSLYEQALTIPERTTNTVSGYAHVVRLGGHGLLFAHTPATEVAEIKLALGAVELDQTASLLSEALALCSPYPQTVPRPQGRRKPFTSTDLRFAAIDQSVWRHPIYEKLVAHLRRNRDDILRPERGLEPVP